jgi:hypothetical protein
MILRALKVEGTTADGKPARTYYDFLEARKENLENFTNHPFRRRTVVDALKLRGLRKRAYTWLWRFDERYGARKGHPG